MADNTTLNAGAGGDTIATDDVAGVKYQVIKLAIGSDGSATLIGSGAPLPVLAGSNSGVDIGDVTINNGTGASAVPIQDGGNSITVDNGGTFAVQATEADGANVTLGAKADAKSTATDTTAISAMSVWKQISASVQAIATSIAGTLTVATHAVTQSGTWTVQPGNTANTTPWLIQQDAEILYISGTAYTVKRVKIDAASSGENTLVAAVVGKKLRVLSVALIAAGTVSLYLNNATDGAIFGGSTNKVALVANTGFVLPMNEYGWCQTGTNNEALRVNLSGAVAVAGSLTYIEV